MTGSIVLFLLAMAAMGWVASIVIRKSNRLGRAAMACAEAETLAAARAATVLARPGMLPDDPLVVSSSSAIEPIAAALTCPLCDGGRHVREHLVETWSGRHLRRVTLRCAACGRDGDVYLRIETVGTN